VHAVGRKEYLLGTWKVKQLEERLLSKKEKTLHLYVKAYSRGLKNCENTNNFLQQN